MSFYNINRFRNLFNYKNKQCSVKIIMLKNKTCLNFIHHISSSAERANSVIKTKKGFSNEDIL